MKPPKKDIYGRMEMETGEKNFIPFRFQGQYEDEEIGLYYNRFRYYDPQIGQYTHGRVKPAKKDIYGKAEKEIGEKNFIPFRFQGQYEDEEIGLYYNRFRYYDSQIGQYTQQDPIGLAGGNPTLYGYVGDTNWWIDVFGLSNSLLDFNQAMKQALEWLECRGFKAEKATLGRFGAIKGKPVGMQTLNKKNRIQS